MRTGVCYYQLRNYGKCFQLMREVVDKFPASPYVNDAYYYIGLGHFQLGHYSRAITALENVGTGLSGEKTTTEKLEAGKRLFVRIDDADLAILDMQRPVEVQCETTSGDREVIKCYLVARNTRLAIGSIPTRLGKPVPGNGQLEVKGDDKVTITYIDEHTADKVLNRKVIRTIPVVGTATVRITDGAFNDSLMGVVLGKDVNLQVTDADRDLTDEADTVKATVFVYRPKSDEELQAEVLQARQQAAGTTAGQRPVAASAPATADSGDGHKPEALRETDRREVVLTEVRLPGRVDAGRPRGAQAETAPKPGQQSQPGQQNQPGPAATTPQPPPDESVHSGVFRVSIPLEKAEKVIPGDSKLQALPGDLLRVVYLDERHRGEGTRQVVAQARCLEGNIGAVRVSQAMISDQELRIQTQLKTARR